MPRPHKVSWHKRGCWTFSLTGPDGKRERFYAPRDYPRTRAGEKKATDWMRAVLEKQAEREIADDEWTLADVFRAYLKWCRDQVAEGESSRLTHEGHRKHLRIANEAPKGDETFGETLVSELTARHLEGLVQGWKDAGLSATTIRNRVGSIQAALNWASKPRADRSREKLIPANPIAGYELPRAEYRGDRYAKAEEVGAFLDWIDARAATVPGKPRRFELMTAKAIRFAALTGARPGEICRLKWSHWDREKRAIVLSRKEHKTGRKTGRPRVILVDQAVESLLLLLESDPDRHPEFVFTHKVRKEWESEEELRRGHPWQPNALTKTVRRLRKLAIMAGLKIDDTGLKRMHLYRLRHTHITDGVQAGGSLSAIAQMHGTSVNMLETTYIHHQVEELHKEAERIKSGRS